jgi:hypothetical protein
VQRAKGESDQEGNVEQVRSAATSEAIMTADDLSVDGRTARGGGFEVGVAD